MNSFSSALTDERFASCDLKISAILKPVRVQLAQTQQFYQETVLQTEERTYLHKLASGETGFWIPEEFRVQVVDKISNHILQSEGKWIRAALVLLTAKACGVAAPAVRQVAVAVELIHLATLVHDDIVDEAPMRRGLSSVPGNWGNSVSVLLGDFLLSKSFKLLLASGSIPSQNLLSQATGQMCLGEIKQLTCSYDTLLTEREYLEMIEYKTASLMAAASASGGHIGGLPEPAIERLHAYGHSLGMAFQITDDILDYTSTSSTLGKPQGGDLRNGKTTLPLIHLFNRDEKQARLILDSPAPMEQKTADLAALMRRLGSIEYAYKIAKRYGDIAKNSLKEIEPGIGPSECLNSLYQLVDFVLARES
ncbi:MAG: polyprenyl synthetase family protein [bacterium]